MKIYRYISQKELDEIKNKKIFRLWQPKKWGLNESIITEVFGFNEYKKAIKEHGIKTTLGTFSTIVSSGHFGKFCVKRNPNR